MSVLAPVFGSSLICRSQHTAIGDIHTGDESNHKNQKQRYNTIFLPVSLKFTQNAAAERIFY